MPLIPQGWRQLALDEIVQRGDEFVSIYSHDSSSTPCRTSIGQAVRVSFDETCSVIRKESNTSKIPSVRPPLAGYPDKNYKYREMAPEEIMTGLGEYYTHFKDNGLSWSQSSWTKVSVKSSFDLSYYIVVQRIKRFPGFQ